MNPFEIDLASLAMLGDVPGVIMSHMEPTVENVPVFVMMAVNIILGFMLCTNAVGVQKRDGKDHLMKVRKLLLPEPKAEAADGQAEYLTEA